MTDAPQDLPKEAGHRLEELEHGLFTSDLSVNEFLLIKEVGFHPLGFVMGSSIYHTGIQTRKWGQSQELTKLTGAMYEARELAMNRMRRRRLSSGPTEWSASGSTSTTTSGGRTPPNSSPWAPR